MSTDRPPAHTDRASADADGPPVGIDHPTVVPGNVEPEEPDAPEPGVPSSER